MRHYKEKHEEFSKYFECPIEAGHFCCKRRPDMRGHLTKAHRTLAPGAVEGLMRNIPHSMRVNRGYVNPVGYVLPPEMVNRQQRTQDGPGRQDVPHIHDPVSSTQAPDVGDFQTTPEGRFTSSTVACMPRRGLPENKASGGSGCETVQRSLHLAECSGAECRPGNVLDPSHGAPIPNKRLQQYGYYVDISYLWGWLPDDPRCLGGFLGWLDRLQEELENVKSEARRRLLSSGVAEAMRDAYVNELMTERRESGRKISTGQDMIVC